MSSWLAQEVRKAIAPLASLHAAFPGKEAGARNQSFESGFSSLRILHPESWHFGLYGSVTRVMCGSIAVRKAKYMLSMQTSKTTYCGETLQAM